MKSLCLYLLFLAISLTCQSSFSEEKINYIIYGGSNTPMQINSNNDLMAGGIVTDIVKSIFENKISVITPLYLPNQRAMAMIKSGDLTNWLGYGTKSWLPEWLMKKIEFSETPIYTHRIVLITNKNTSIKFNGFDSLSNKSIAVISGFPKPWLSNKTRIYNYKLSHVKSGEAAIKMLLSGRVEGFFGDGLRINYLLENHKGFHREKLAVTDLSHYIKPENVYLAFDKTISIEMKGFINERSLALNKKGVISKIVTQYTDPEKVKTPSLISTLPKPE